MKIWGTERCSWYRQLASTRLPVVLDADADADADLKTFKHCLLIKALMSALPHTQPYLFECTCLHNIEETLWSVVSHANVHMAVAIEGWHCPSVVLFHQ